MTGGRPIYLDYNATTPIDPAVAAAMQPFLTEGWGNPSSTHWYGVRAKQAVEEARTRVADLLGCRPDEVVFTSGGSESNNWAIKGSAYVLRDKGNHIITSAIEHPAVTEVCRQLEREGFQVTWLPVSNHGRVSVEAVRDAIMPGTILITIMHANNEVGTTQPVDEIAVLAKEHGIRLHTDAAQSVGKIPVRVDQLGVDLLSLAGHKLYAPKGIGALYVRSGTDLARLIHGADHERGMRAGTENVLEAVGLGKACELAGERLGADMQHVRRMRDRLWKGLCEALPDIRLNGHPEHRLPNTLSVSFRHVEANILLSELTGVAASAGAACHTDRVDVSAVLEAMDVPLEYAMGTVRFSTGRYTRPEDVDNAVEQIVGVVNRLQVAGPAPVAEKGEEIRLTRFTRGMGCACKIRPQLLESILKDIPLPVDPDILVGANVSDDAAVIRISADTAIVATVDFFTPVVDDPATFGAVAAANALSDVYAMGAQPLFALNIVGFPVDRLPIDVLKDILNGGRRKLEEAGIPILGGHSVEDVEPKYGMVVIGTVHPDKVITNSGARPGDVLVLTKPLGTGVLATALKRDLLSGSDALAAADVMATLNRSAADVMRRFQVHACTDITGFGLLGHLHEMTSASNVTAEVNAPQVPILPKARELAMQGIVPGGTENNLSHLGDRVIWDKGLARTDQLLLTDAQTSGGLLIACSGECVADLVATMEKADVHAVIIGKITGTGPGTIRVTGE